MSFMLKSFRVVAHKTLVSAPVPIGIGVRGLRLGLDNICVSQEQVEMEKEKRKQLLEDNRRLQQKRDEMYQLYLHMKQELERKGFNFF